MILTHRHPGPLEGFSEVGLRFGELLMERRQGSKVVQSTDDARVILVPAPSALDSQRLEEQWLELAVVSSTDLRCGQVRQSLWGRQMIISVPVPGACEDLTVQIFRLPWESFPRADVVPGQRGARRARLQGNRYRLPS